MIFVDWFWIVWYSLLGLVVVLFWFVEFTESKAGKRSKRKSIWQESRERVHQQQYRSTYGSAVPYGSTRNYRKGM